jgi:hypothetical protein
MHPAGWRSSSHEHPISRIHAHGGSYQPRPGGQQRNHAGIIGRSLDLDDRKLKRAPCSRVGTIFRKLSEPDQDFEAD